MDESGLINVYLTIVSFLFSPIEAEDLIRLEGQIEAMNLQSQLYTKQLKASLKLTSSEMSAIRSDSMRSGGKSNGRQLLQEMREQNEIVFKKINDKMIEKQN